MRKIELIKSVLPKSKWNVDTDTDKKDVGLCFDDLNKVKAAYPESDGWRYTYYIKISENEGARVNDEKDPRIQYIVLHKD